MDNCYSDNHPTRMKGKELIDFFNRETGYTLVDGFAKLMDEGEEANITPALLLLPAI